MGAIRQKRQEQLAFPFAEGSEASRSETEGTEAPRARRETEDPAGDSITNRTAVYGSVRTVVWEGWRSDPSPYPDRSSLSLPEITLRLCCYGGPTIGVPFRPADRDCATHDLPTRVLVYPTL